MKKVMKKYGNSLVIHFTLEERTIHDLNEGDIIEFRIKHITKKESVEDTKSDPSPALQNSRGKK